MFGVLVNAIVSSNPVHYRYKPLRTFWGTKIPRFLWAGLICDKPGNYCEEEKNFPMTEKQSLKKQTFAGYTFGEVFD
jgi:hypothetical protein